MSTFVQRNRDFCKALTDMQFAYIEAEAENAKLREELAKARDPQRIGGQADPSSFVYAIEQLREFRWQHATNDEDAIPYINNVAAAHERENAKLRELVEDMYACISHANEQDWFYFERDKFGCGMSCTVNGEACGLRTLADRMRELFGKENDGCDLV